MICDSIGVVPKANNGTLRLPLKPIGLHTDEHMPPLEIPYDAPAAALSTATPVPTVAMSQADNDASASSKPAADATNILSTETAVPTNADNASNGVGQAGGEDAAYDPGKNENLNWWHWLGDKFHGAKGWIEEIGMGKGADEETEGV